MMDIYIPDMYLKSIYHINYDKLKEDGIKCILFDLDNTIIPYKEKEPSKKLIDLIENLKDMEFKIIIFDNTNKKRLLPFKRQLDIDCAPNAKKPSIEKLIKIIKEYKYDLSEVALVGDELYRDIYGGNKAGIKTILVNPISNKDSLKTKFYRIFEKKIIKKLNKRGILIKGKYYE